MNVAGAGDDRSELELATMDIPPTGEGAGCANMTALLARDGKLNRGDAEGHAEEDEAVAAIAHSESSSTLLSNAECSACVSVPSDRAPSA